MSSMLTVRKTNGCSSLSLTS